MWGPNRRSFAVTLRTIKWDSGNRETQKSWRLENGKLSWGKSIKRGVFWKSTDGKTFWGEKIQIQIKSRTGVLQSDLQREKHEDKHSTQKYERFGNKKL